MPRSHSARRISRLLDQSERCLSLRTPWPWLLDSRLSLREAKALSKGSCKFHLVPCISTCADRHRNANAGSYMSSQAAVTGMTEKWDARGKAYVNWGMISEPVGSVIESAGNTTKTITRGTMSQMVLPKSILSRPGKYLLNHLLCGSSICVPVCPLASLLLQLLFM